MNETMYMISESELKELLKQKLILTALEYGGVDDWEWYDESLRVFRREWLESNIMPSCYINYEEMAKFELAKYEEVI